MHVHMYVRIVRTSQSRHFIFVCGAKKRKKRKEKKKKEEEEEEEEEEEKREEKELLISVAWRSDGS